MIQTKYGILFTLELLHNFYVDKRCDDFMITPSQDTQKVLNGNKIVTKQYDYQLYAGIQTDTTGIPFTIPGKDLQLTFFLYLNNSLFFNYTNLPSSYPSGKLYYFSNRNDNAANGKNFLSQKIDVYSSSKKYVPGDLATNAGGTVFEAIRSSDSATPFDLSHADHWMQIDKNKYMSEADALQWLPSISNYNFLSPQPSAVVHVAGYNTATNDFSNVVLDKTVNFPQSQSSFQLDLSILAAGKYKLTVNGKDSFIYLNDELKTSKPFAVLDIFNDDSVVASYRLLDATNNLLSPLYTIHFLNRSTIWKYVLASGLSGSVNDLDSVFNFANPANVIFSTTPIPLTQQPKNFRLSVNTHNYSPIATASPERLVNRVQSGDTYYCSEIYLNY